MTDSKRPLELGKLPTGIVGFDQIANGGIPRGRSTLLAGTAGSGKTVMALQFLLAGVRDDAEPVDRTVEVLKFRGATHHKGEYPFTIDSEDGATIIPLSAIELEQRSSNVGVSCGVPEIDQKCSGGMYRDSIMLVSGATGTGKTLMVSQYVKAAIEAGERALLFAAEECREQLTRNAAHWGVDFEKAERDGLLLIICRYPEVMGLEDHLLQIKRDMRDFKPHRVAIDSMSAFERVSTPKSFRECTIDNTGMHVLAPFRGVHGILTGAPTYTFDEERLRLGGMFGSTG